MASGNKIVVTPDPQGVRLEGTISGTPAPGVMMEIMATALINGRPTYRVMQRGTDGQRCMPVILDVNPYNGMLATDAYATGDHGFFYVPKIGEELNVLVKDPIGTAAVHNIGDYLIVNSGTGKFVTTTGSPQAEPFVLEEAGTYATDKLMLAMFTGQ